MPAQTQTPAQSPHRHALAFLLRAGLIAAVVAFAAAGSAAGQGPAAPAAAAITPFPWTFSVAEGQAYSGIVAAFLDLESVSAGNFTNVFINWGDGTISSGTVQQSGVESHVFFISEPHTFTEEAHLWLGCHLPTTTTAPPSALPTRSARWAMPPCVPACPLLWASPRPSLVSAATALAGEHLTR